MAENLLNLENVTAHVPGDASRVLLDAVSLGVERGDRIGVVGLNGGGKTTLLDVITGERPVEGGRISRVGGLRMAHLSQHDRFPAGSTVRDIVLRHYDADHEWASDPRVRDVLDGLGVAPRSAAGAVSESALDRPTDGLSGGEKRRVALAAALVGDLDLVVLDEPTNHLDVEGISWLARHLVDRRVALVVVTHDRWFLDTVCTRTWEVANGRVESYLGGYADWVYARAERARQADAAEQRRRNLARKELAWLRRGPPARTSKPRYRIEAAEALIADVPAPRNTVELMQFATNRLGRTVLELEDATAVVGGRTLLDRVTWRLGPGDRVGIVGVNGSGKTTLLRSLSGERELDGGRRVQGSTVKLAQLTQELVDLPAEMRVLEATEAVAKYVRFGKQEMTASQVLERLGFPASRQWTPVGRLSGGERRRLQLTRLLMDEPNVLLLDEPTNDLDVDTLTGLEDLLDGWPGTLVVVSHDRYLTERVCDQVLALFGDGKLTHLPGGIPEYLQRRAAAGQGAGVAPPVTTGTPTAGPAAPKVDAAAQRAARKEAQRLERRMDQLTSREEKLHAQLAEAATDPSRLVELDRELKDVVAERESVEAEWLEAAERAEG
ncbi:ABC-F family ATP-binding cassette domain-containing protein [Pseudonocardia sp. C8]|uniref:ABC-F family ATP-binding cassette domain-containing protein n=1 Tax=Pseudonocardia sp. C8 TaxID=2762759 RepID=UPI001642E32E|nr:ABC-F family ATP-binding cassette domain-containing protein [Pseudonocardia sp. C8]MBC3190032.1 ABC-F family ATP-binding cassette domain-containing protein [Pseudonocardia sp. C8]